MIDTIKKNRKPYLMEAFGLMGFVIFSALLTIYLEHPDMPVMQSSFKDYPMLRRIPLGIIMGIYILIITLLFGKKSGAHINPAVTWTYYRLDKIVFKDALFYMLAQFVGAVIGVLLLRYFIPNWFGHPTIDFSVTKPKPQYHVLMAFCAEFIISFIMMLGVLLASSSKRFEKYAALISGIFIALFLIFEIPFSGMSLNPARSFAGAFAANKWEHLWVYFVAPPLAMFIAAEIFTHWRKSRLQKQSSDFKDLMTYPVTKAD